jgi:hypothetical protein
MTGEQHVRIILVFIYFSTSGPNRAENLAHRGAIRQMPMWMALIYTTRAPGRAISDVGSGGQEFRVK